MNCPRDNTVLTKEMLRDIEIDRCHRCKGIWLDFHELDQLEDTVFDKDELKGILEYSPRPGDVKCPECNGAMTTFNYRAYDLPIDSCDVNHGFWLDAGEDKRVLELMKKRIKDLNRSVKAEKEWYGLIAKLRLKRKKH